MKTMFFDKRTLVSILSVLFLLIILPLAVVLVQQRQEIRKKAVGPGTAQMWLDPSSHGITLPQATFPVDIKIKAPQTTNNLGIVGVDAVLSYTFSGNTPPLLLATGNPSDDISKGLPDPWSYVFRQVEISGNTLTISISAVYLQGGTQGYDASSEKTFVTLNFHPQMTGSVALMFDTALTKIKEKATNNDILQTPTNGQYNVAAIVATGTPTPTITPIPTVSVPPSAGCWGVNGCDPGCNKSAVTPNMVYTTCNPSNCGGSWKRSDGNPPTGLTGRCLDVTFSQSNCGGGFVGYFVWSTPVCSSDGSNSCFEVLNSLGTQSFNGQCENCGQQTCPGSNCADRTGQSRELFSSYNQLVWFGQYSYSVANSVTKYTGSGGCSTDGTGSCYKLTNGATYYTAGASCGGSGCPSGTYYDSTPCVWITPSPTPTAIPTATATPTPTATATPAPTATSTPIPTATATPIPTATSTPVPTATSTPKPTATPIPTATATPIPTATSAPLPTATPTITLTPTPTKVITCTISQNPAGPLGPLVSKQLTNEPSGGTSYTYDWGNPVCGFANPSCGSVNPTDSKTTMFTAPNAYSASCLVRSRVTDISGAWGCCETIVNTIPEPGATPTPTITPSITPTPTPTVTPTVTPTGMPTLTPTITLTPTVTPTTPPGETTLTFRINFQNTPSPSGTRILSNVTVKRSGTVFADQNNVTVTAGGGYYQGQVTLTGSPTSGSDFIVCFKGQNHLRKKFANVTINVGGNNTLDRSGTVDKLIVGDVNDDNMITSADKGAVLAVWTAPQTPVTDANRRYDLNENGYIDSGDLGWFLANWTSPVVSGDVCE